MFAATSSNRCSTVAQLGGSSLQRNAGEGKKWTVMTFASHHNEFAVIRLILFAHPVMDWQRPTPTAASHTGLPGTAARQRSCQGRGGAGPRAKGTHASEGIWQSWSAKAREGENERNI